MQLALFPLLLVTVIIAVPGFLVETLPLLSTTATSSLLLFHVSFLLLAVTGEIVAAKVSLSPSVNVRAVLFNETLSTSMVPYLSELSVNALITKLHEYACP